MSGHLTPLDSYPATAAALVDDASEACGHCPPEFVGLLRHLADTVPGAAESTVAYLRAVLG